MRLLIIEDERRVAENIAAALREGPGYAVDLAYDGEEGAHLAAKSSIWGPNDSPASESLSPHFGHFYSQKFPHLPAKSRFLLNPENRLRGVFAPEMPPFLCRGESKSVFWLATAAPRPTRSAMPAPDQSMPLAKPEYSPLPAPQRQFPSAQRKDLMHRTAEAHRAWNS